MNACRICKRDIQAEGHPAPCAHSACLEGSKLIWRPPRSRPEIERLICKFHLRPFDMARRFVRMSDRYRFFSFPSFGQDEVGAQMGEVLVSDWSCVGLNGHGMFPMLGKRKNASIIDLPQYLFNSRILRSITSQLRIRHKLQHLLPMTISDMSVQALEGLDFAFLFQRAFQLNHELFGGEHDLTLRQQLFFLLKYDPVFVDSAIRKCHGMKTQEDAVGLVPLAQSSNLRKPCAICLNRSPRSLKVIVESHNEAFLLRWSSRWPPTIKKVKRNSASLLKKPSRLSRVVCLGCILEHDLVSFVKKSDHQILISTCKDLVLEGDHKRYLLGKEKNTWQDDWMRDRHKARLKRIKGGKQKKGKERKVRSGRKPPKRAEAKRQVETNGTNPGSRKVHALTHKGVGLTLLKSSTKELDSGNPNIAQWQTQQSQIAMNSVGRDNRFLPAMNHLIVKNNIIGLSRPIINQGPQIHPRNGTNFMRFQQRRTKTNSLTSQIEELKLPRGEHRPANAPNRDPQAQPDLPAQITKNLDFLHQTDLTNSSSSLDMFLKEQLEKILSAFQKKYKNNKRLFLENFNKQFQIEDEIGLLILLSPDERPGVLEFQKIKKRGQNRLQHANPQNTKMVNMQNQDHQTPSQKTGFLRRSNTVEGLITSNATIEYYFQDIWNQLLPMAVPDKPGFLASSHESNAEEEKQQSQILNPKEPEIVENQANIGSNIVIKEQVPIKYGPGPIIFKTENEAQEKLKANKEEQTKVVEPKQDKKSLKISNSKTLSKSRSKNPLKSTKIIFKEDIQLIRAEISLKNEKVLDNVELNRISKQNLRRQSSHRQMENKINGFIKKGNPQKSKYQIKHVSKNSRKIKKSFSKRPSKYEKKNKNYKLFRNFKKRRNIYKSKFPTQERRSGVSNSRRMNPVMTLEPENSKLFSKKSVSNQESENLKMKIDSNENGNDEEERKNKTKSSIRILFGDWTVVGDQKKKNKNEKSKNLIKENPKFGNVLLSPNQNTQNVKLMAKDDSVLPNLDLNLDFRTSKVNQPKLKPKNPNRSVLDFKAFESDQKTERNQSKNQMTETETQNQNLKMIPRKKKGQFLIRFQIGKKKLNVSTEIQKHSQIVEESQIENANHVEDPKMNLFLQNKSKIIIKKQEPEKEKKLEPNDPNKISDNTNIKPQIEMIRDTKHVPVQVSKSEPRIDAHIDAEKTAQFATKIPFFQHKSLPKIRAMGDLDWGRNSDSESSSPECSDEDWINTKFSELKYEDDGYAIIKKRKSARLLKAKQKDHTENSEQSGKESLDNNKSGITKTKNKTEKNLELNSEQIPLPNLKPKEPKLADVKVTGTGDILINQPKSMLRSPPKSAQNNFSFKIKLFDSTPRIFCLDTPKKEPKIENPKSLFKNDISSPKIIEINDTTKEGTKDNDLLSKNNVKAEGPIGKNISKISMEVGRSQKSNKETLKEKVQRTNRVIKKSGAKKNMKKSRRKTNKYYKIKPKLEPVIQAPTLDPENSLQIIEEKIDFQIPEDPKHDQIIKISKQWRQMTDSKLKIKERSKKAKDFKKGPKSGYLSHNTGIFLETSSKHLSEGETPNREPQAKAIIPTQETKPQAPKGNPKNKKKQQKTKPKKPKRNQPNSTGIDPKSIFENGWNWQASHPGIGLETEQLRKRLAKLEYTWTQSLKKTLSDNAMPPVNPETLHAIAQSSGSEYNHNPNQLKNTSCQVHYRKGRQRRSTFYLDKLKHLDMAQLEKQFYDLLSEPSFDNKKGSQELVIEEKEHVKWDEVESLYFDDTKIDAGQFDLLGKKLFKSLYSEFLLFNQDNQKTFPEMFKRAVENAHKKYITKVERTKHMERQRIISQRMVMHQPQQNEFYMREQQMYRLQAQGAPIPSTNYSSHSYQRARAQAQLALQVSGNDGSRFNSSQNSLLTNHLQNSHFGMRSYNSSSQRYSQRNGLRISERQHTPSSGQHMRNHMGQRGDAISHSISSVHRMNHRALRPDINPFEWKIRYLSQEIRIINKQSIRKYEKKMSDKIKKLTSSARKYLLFPKTIDKIMNLTQKGSTNIDYFDQFVYPTEVRFRQLEGAVDAHRGKLVNRLLESIPKLFWNFDKSIFMNRAVLAGLQDLGKDRGLKVTEKMFLNFGFRFFEKSIELNPRTRTNWSTSFNNLLSRLPSAVVSNFAKEQETLLLNLSKEFGVLQSLLKRMEFLTSEEHQLTNEHLLLDDPNKLDETDCVLCFTAITCLSNPIIYCSKCERGAHKICLRLDKVPMGDFWCPNCVPLTLQVNKRAVKSQKKNSRSGRLTQATNQPKLSLQKRHRIASVYKTKELCIEKELIKLPDNFLTSQNIDSQMSQLLNIKFESKVVAIEEDWTRLNITELMFFEIVGSLIRMNLKLLFEKKNLDVKAQNEGERIRKRRDTWLKLDIEAKELSIRRDQVKEHQIVNWDGSKINIDQLTDEISEELTAEPGTGARRMRKSSGSARLVTAGAKSKTEEMPEPNFQLKNQRISLQIRITTLSFQTKRNSRTRIKIRLF